MQTHVTTIPKPKYPKRLIGFVIFSLLAIGICMKLGLWQLARAQEKQALLDIDQTVITTLSQVTAHNLHHSVSLQGYFDNQQPLLLDNQINNKRIGYHLYLPFHSDEQTILVNLGWLAASPSRQV
jgi:surfeit locus 1 family protein